MNIQNLLLPNQLENLKNLIISYKDLGDQLRDMIGSDKKLAKYFVDTKAAIIANELYGEEFLKNNPLYIEGEKTSLCNAIYYMKDLGKKALGLKTRQQKQKESEKENEKEQAKLKDLHQIVAEFTYISNRINEFDDQALNGILAGIERLHKVVKEKVNDNQATKAKTTKAKTTKAKTTKAK